MKFFLSWKLRPIPPEMLKTALDLIPKEVKYQEDLAKKGKILAAYSFTGRGEGIQILEAESHEELTTLLMQDPYFPFLEFCVTPIVDFKFSIEVWRKVLEAIAKK